MLSGGLIWRRRRLGAVIGGRKALSSRPPRRFLHRPQLTAKPPPASREVSPLRRRRRQYDARRVPFTARARAIQSEEGRACRRRGGPHLARRPRGARSLDPRAAPRAAGGRVCPCADVTASPPRTRGRRLRSTTDRTELRAVHFLRVAEAGVLRPQRASAVSPLPRGRAGWRMEG